MHRSKENGSRYSVLLKYDWKFMKGDPSKAECIGFDDSNWESVRVPHDWAIKGPFDPGHDVQLKSVIEDGITNELKHIGRTGGLPITGTGWYRTRFCIPEENRGKRIFIAFDGVMSNSTIFLNGKKIGFWAYGYTSFSFELTDHILFGKDNLLAVKVSPKPSSSRWYTGAGIYRNVRLVITDPLHIQHWGTWITTPRISAKEAVVDIKTDVVNQSGEAKTAELVTIILTPDGQEAARIRSEEKINHTSHRFEQAISLQNPILWDLGSCDLYRAVSILCTDGRETDRYETHFGIRTVAFDADKGFFLNGRGLKLKGVCLHHDLGPLGTAVNESALKRQLEMLQDIGCNAIRTSHNPPTPELLDMCDEMGFLVIDEAFDEWEIGKIENSYHVLFEEWAEKDLRAMIKRDRNHPCVIMWSIGNEIREQSSQDGAKTAQFLTDICHDEDPTRPVTAGFNHAQGAIENGLAEVVDIVGWNYKSAHYARYHKEHPHWIMYGSETVSCVSSRGEYYLPVQEELSVPNRANLHVNSYDMSTVHWGVTPEYELEAQEECEYILGEFVWTGFDYLGEPTPYREEWPSRSSYFGIIDLCGIPKDRYYLYRSQWSKKPTLHLLPHWNWEGHEGQGIPVHCYTSYESAELFLNGKSLGVRKKDDKVLYSRYRLIWEDVPYEPGVLKVDAYDADGEIAMTYEVRTAGEPAKITLQPDRDVQYADGEAFFFITVRIVDEKGVLCPKANHPVRYTVEGPGEIVGIGNGDPTSTESFMTNPRKSFNGMSMLMVRTIKDKPGTIVIRGQSEGLVEGAAQVKTGMAGFNE
ncbi:MAG: DUF4982 domain-containing protein [Firmicutes bacterium]|nr:DUF4982 domain-containing protein [Bacillota bacterium]